MATLSSVRADTLSTSFYESSPSVGYKLWERGRLKFSDLVSLEDLKALFKIKALKPDIFNRNITDGFTTAILLEIQEVAQFFIMNGVDVQGTVTLIDEEVYEELTWLGFAIKQNKPRSVRFLIQQGADKNKTDGSGWGNLPAWKLAAASGALECLQVIFDEDPDSREELVWPSLALFHSSKLFFLSEEQKIEISKNYAQSLQIADFLIKKGVVPTEKYEYLSLARTWVIQKAFDKLKEGILLARTVLEPDEFTDFIENRLICEIYNAFKKFHPKEPFPTEVFDFLIEHGALIHAEAEAGLMQYSLLEEAVEFLDNQAVKYCFSKGVPLNCVKRENGLSLWEHLVAKHSFKQAYFLASFGAKVQISIQAWHFVFEEFFSRLEFSTMHYAHHLLLASSEPSEGRTEEGFDLKVTSKSDEPFEGYGNKVSRFRLERGSGRLDATRTITQMTEEKAATTSRATTEEGVDGGTVLPAHGGAGRPITPIKEESEVGAEKQFFNRFVMGFKLLKKMRGEAPFLYEFNEFLSSDRRDFYHRYTEFFRRIKQHPLKRILDLPERVSMEESVDTLFNYLLAEVS